MPTVDPRFIFWFGLWTSVLMLIVTGVINFEGAIPFFLVPVVTKWAGILAVINNLILTALTGRSSDKPGPLVKMPSIDATGAVVKIMLVAFALSMFLAGNSAHAASTVPTPPAKQCLIPLDPLKLCGALTGNASTDLQRVADRIKAATKDDLKYAIAKATAANTNGARVRLQCFQAISDANDQANGVGLKNPDGTPMVRPSPAVISSVEDIAELVDNLSPQGTLLTSCAGAAELFKTTALQVVNQLVTGATGLAAGTAATAALGL